MYTTGMKSQWAVYLNPDGSYTFSAELVQALDEAVLTLEQIHDIPVYAGHADEFVNEAKGLAHTAIERLEGFLNAEGTAAQES
jgi:hypothetical protein